MSETSSVPKEARHGVEVGDHDWSWVEGSIWTERMLTVLGNGIKGGNWRWPNAFFAACGLYTMKTAHELASQSR